MCLIVQKSKCDDQIKDWRTFNFNSMKTISLHGNDESIPFNIQSFGKNCLNEFTLLETLDLEGNKFKMIECKMFACLKNLKSLDLNSNQIEQIETCGFQGLVSLEVLNLGGNKLTKLESNSFQHLDKLKKLFLFLNQINRIEKDAFVGLQ